MNEGVVKDEEQRGEMSDRRCGAFTKRAILALDCFCGRWRDQGLKEIAGGPFFRFVEILERGGVINECKAIKIANGEPWGNFQDVSDKPLRTESPDQSFG